MKLKYYLRGLASGIVVTTLILTIAFSGRKDTISDKEIMERAEKLGMMKPEEETKDLLTATEKAGVSEAPVVSDKPEVTEKASTPVPTNAPTEVPTVAEKKMLTIVSGMWSEKVAQELEAMGIIEDAMDFDKYLVSHGYADKIIVGTFEIPSEASYEEVANIITGR